MTTHQFPGFFLLFLKPSLKALLYFNKREISIWKHHNTVEVINKIEEEEECNITYYAGFFFLWQNVIRIKVL